MKSAKIGELRNHLSRYLDHVKAGGTVTVLQRDRPVAQIIPLPTAGQRRLNVETRLARLERRGLIRRGRGGLPDWFKRRRPSRLRGSVLKDLLDERQSGW